MPQPLRVHLFRSVRGRLVLLVAALVLPVAALACAMVIQGYRNQRAGVGNTLLSTARAISGVVDAKVAETDAVLKTIAESALLARDDLEGVQHMARQALAGDSGWFVLLDPDGQQRVNTRLPPGTPLPKTAVAVETVAALQRGEVYVSDLRTSTATSERVVHVARAYFRDGQLTYILSVSIAADALAQSLDVTRYAPGRIVVVVDRTGTIIVRTRNPHRYVGHPAAPDIVAATTTRSEGIVDSVTLEGIPVVTAFSRAKCGWSTAIGVPKTELYTSARRLLAWGGGGTALLLLVAIAMAAWVGRALVRGTDVLLAEATALGRGGMPVEVSSGLDEVDFVSSAMRRTAETLLRRTRTLEVLNRINAALVAERDLERILDRVTDAARELSGAEVAAFFYDVQQGDPNPVTLCTVSGAPRAAVAGLIVRNAPLFELAMKTGDVLRVPDITLDERFRDTPPYFGLAAGNIPVRSYLAVPVAGGAGRVVGGLFFGHREPGIFTQEAEDIVVGLAAEATIAVDNAKLYHALARELEAKSKAEAELRHAELRLREHARELERSVAERTASLREAVGQMEEFSYTVSHDLRAPLRAMHAFADALLEDYAPQLDETARDYIHRIQRASRRMDLLTTDLLNYSRVVRADVRLEPTDLERVVRSTIEHYSELQPESAVLDIRAPLLSVLAHEPSLTQCLANLLTNAAKFVRPGERPRITVRTERRDGRVRIWVEDKGIGIPPEHQARLFRIFERVPNQPEYDGTGIGLAIVRKAAEKMGGTCGVESDGASGARFWVELPAAG